MSAQPKVRNDIPRSTQKVSWKNGTIPSLSWSKNLVMAIVTVLAVQTIIAIETVMAIVTALAIKTIIYFSGIEPGIKFKEFIPGWLL